MPAASKKVSLLIFAALFIAGAYWHQAVDYDNTASRYFLLSAVVDYGTFSIDVYAQKTIDLSYYNGHYYSNKAIGAPLLGLPVYWAIRHLPFAGNSAPLSPPAKYLVRLVTTTLPFAVLGVVMFRLACLAGAGAVNALLMVAAYSFGTIALVHATLFSGHQIAASFLFFSFALLFDASGSKATASRLPMAVRFLIAGVLAGFAVITDFPAVIIALLLTIYVLSLRLPSRHFLSFVLGGLICAVLVAAYNWLCFDSSISMSYAHLSDEQFREEAAAGLFGIRLPQFKTLAAILFSPWRGLFTIMPVQVLSVAGLGAMIVRGENRREAIFIVAVFMAYLAFNAGYCGWHGGWTYGPRYLVPMLPFLAFAMAFGRWNYRVFFLLFLLSAGQVLPAVIGMPHVPEVVRNPLIEVVLPLMNDGYLARNPGMLFGLTNLASSIPAGIIVGLLFYKAFRVVRAEPQQAGRSGRARVAIVFYLWFITVIGLLAFTATERKGVVHAYRWLLLSHASWVMNSPELMQAAEREAALAGDILHNYRP